MCNDTKSEKQWNNGNKQSDWAGVQNVSGWSPMLVTRMYNADKQFVFLKLSLLLLFLQFVLTISQLPQFWHPLQVRPMLGREKREKA